MPHQITGERLTSMFRPRSIALVGASDKSTFSMLAYPAVYINQVMQPVTDYSRASMEHGQVPYVIPGLRQAMVALRNIAWWSQAASAPAVSEAAEAVPVPAPDQRRGKWPETAARRLLGDAGIPVVPARLAGSADEAVKAAADIGGPLAIKIVSADIPHKSDIGGIFVEVLQDSVLTLLPVTPAQARGLLDRLRGRAVLRVDGATIEALDAAVTWTGKGPEH
jgi:acyl-CoA synthetase (NDP forming)